MQYLYNDGELYYFMDPETYEQIPLDAGTSSGDAIRFVKEETMATRCVSFKGKAFSVEAPNFVVLEVTDTEPGFKGDTTSNRNHQAGDPGDRLSDFCAAVHQHRRQDPCGYPRRLLHVPRVSDYKA